MLPALIILGSVAYSGARTLLQNLKRPALALPPPDDAESEATKPNLEASAGAEPTTPPPTQILPEPAVDHALTLAGVATAASVVGYFLPAARIVPVAILSYAMLPLLDTAFQKTFIERRTHASQIDSLLVVVSMLRGYYLLASVCSGVYFYGLKLVHQTQTRSKHRLEHLFGENPRHVWLAREETEVEVPFESLEAGDIIVLQAGEFVPIDGTIIRGIATIDQRTLTGESHPVEKVVGDTVLASTTLVAGKLFVRVDKTGAQTTAANIQRILDNTKDYTNAVEQEAIQISNKLAGPTLLAGCASIPFIGPFGGLALVGCNLSDLNRVSGPVGILNYLDLTAERGILVKDGRTLELLKGVDTIVFDKTGTLTLDQPELGRIYTLGDLSEKELLRIAATAEARQSHPIANAILAAAEAQGISPAQLDEAAYEIGYGLKVTCESKVIHLGSARFMKNECVVVRDPTEIESIQAYCDHHGFSLVYMAYDHRLVGAFEMHSMIRPEVYGVITQLKARGLDLYIVSGDHDEPTKRLAGQLEIPHYFANVLPDQKASIIQRLRTEGKSICFIGDGINDAVALKTANVGISIHGSSDAALDTAGIILMDRTLKQLGSLFDFADELAKNRKQGYYATMIPGALGAVAVLTMGLGLSGALVLYIFGGFTAFVTANLPRLAHRNDRKKKAIRLITHPTSEPLPEPTQPPQSGSELH